MKYKIYEKILDDEMIKYILSNKEKYISNPGKVGNRVNLNQKRRTDIFINIKEILEKIDNTVYNSIYKDVKENFSDIKYREKWKIGHYHNNEQGFYNLHTDTAGETSYRKTSCVCMLSETTDYEGGELHFPELKKKFKLDKGDIIIFDSTILHGVYPVTTGERYVLISFFFDDVGINKKNIDNYKPILKDIRINYPEKKSVILSSVNKTQMGDIDYSDLHNNKWNEKDDYIYEDNKSDTLFVLFSGMGWKQSKPTFIFYNFLKSYNNIDKLFIRDIKMRYYLTGLKNTTSNLNETIEYIKQLTTVKKYKKIVALGCSAGGYAAIFYGLLLNFNKIIAFSPQTVLNEKKESIIKDIYNAPNTCIWLRDLNKEDKEYQKALDLKNYQPFTSDIEIHYSVNGNKGIDKNHAEYILEDRCKLIEHPGNDHMVALTLRNNGKLKKIIDEAI